MRGAWEKRGLVAAGAVVIGLLAMPAAASAAVTCSYDEGSDTMTVNSSAASGTELALVTSASPGGEIAVSDGSAQVTCTGAGGPPTGNNTGNVNLTGGAGDSVWFLGDPENFAPGPGGDLDFLAALGSGADGIAVVDTTANGDFWVLGAGGMNWNGDVDVDLSLLSVEETVMLGLGGADALTARGQDGTGAPFAGEFGADGGEGNDVIEGGDGADFLLGGENDDTLRGFGGDDELGGDAGTNQLVGGPGDDRADYLSANGGVTVDLNVSGAQSTGFSTDTLSEIEGLSGSNTADTLTGDGAANRLLGQDGDDTLDGRGGPDQLNGGAGVNTATYALAPAGVTADLAEGTVTGGAGDDSLSGVANLIGTPFSDSLTGGGDDNSIVGLAGADTVAARAGTDFVSVRDGGPDSASCGDGVDSATADRASVDSVNADCENVSFLPEPPAPDGGNGGNGVGGDTEVSFDLTGKARQRVVQQKGVIVKASCPQEACTATASGTGKLPKPKRTALARLNLKPVTESVSAGATERIKLRLKRKQLQAVAKALRDGRKPKVIVSADVTDAVGNVATDRLTVRVRR